MNYIYAIYEGFYKHFHNGLTKTQYHYSLECKKKIQENQVNKFSARDMIHELDLLENIIIKDEFDEATLEFLETLLSIHNNKIKYIYGK